MGTFLGHVVPGTFFGLFSFWWAWNVFHRYFMCQREITEGSYGSIMKKKSPLRYKNTLSYPCPCCCSKIPLEGILKVIAVIVGMTGEFVEAFEHGQFTHINNAQHMTMFFFFGLNGVMDILQHFRIPLPPDLEYVSGILALAMEALLFYYHLHGRSPMDVQVHMFLFYVIVSSAVVTAFEMRYRFNVLPALCRVFFTMLQGTWFYQIGFVLYPPNENYWDENSHKHMMIVTLLFTWHHAIIFVLLLIMGIIIYFRVKAMDRSDIHQYLHPFISLNATSDFKSKIDAEQSKNIMADSEEEEV